MITNHDNCLHTSDRYFVNAYEVLGSFTIVREFKHVCRPDPQWKALGLDRAMTFNEFIASDFWQKITIISSALANSWKASLTNAFNILMIMDVAIVSARFASCPKYA